VQARLTKSQPTTTSTFFELKNTDQARVSAGMRSECGRIAHRFSSNLRSIALSDFRGWRAAHMMLL
jgi:hypothetical protein